MGVFVIISQLIMGVFVIISGCLCCLLLSFSRRLTSAPLTLGVHFCSFTRQLVDLHVALLILIQAIHSDHLYN